MNEINLIDNLNSRIVCLEKEKKDLELRLAQALAALGYPTPGGIPESDLKCGLCARKENDYQEKKIELRTLWQAFRVLNELRNK